MNNFFNSVHITNFKSLKDVTLSDCKRINLLIGKPNVGKSNILEAIGLFSLPYIKYNKSKKLTQFIRLENIAELFFDGNIDEKITINTDDDSSCTVDYFKQKGLAQFQIDLRNQYGHTSNLGRIRIKATPLSDGEKLANVAISLEAPDQEVKELFNIDFSKLPKNSFRESYLEGIKKKVEGIKKKVEDSIIGLEDPQEIENQIKAELDRLDAGIWSFPVSINVDNRLNLTFTNRSRGRSYSDTPKVSFYKFPQTFAFKKPSIFFHNLLPPSGANLLEVIEHDKLLENELSALFTEYGLKLLFDKTNQTLRIDKSLKENAASFPFSSIADTLQRLVFFKAAIASNKNSILLFEEPEAHCFPPYIAQITQEIIDSETNQFFIATHSPYVLNDFMEDKNTRAELAIYMADFKDGQTVVYRLTDEELDEVYNHGIDVFFNYERFTAHG